jgi:REP element-mobilizing transposase RayT
MKQKSFESGRKSVMILDEVYFWTATINKWIQLLTPTHRKQIIMDSLKFLSQSGFITVYAFVIMPNHVHLIWRQNKKNGGEMPYASFLKFTSRLFLNELKADPEFLSRFEVKAANKQYNFWQRDSLAFELFTKRVAFQKLNYIHNNPISGKWNLCEYPEQYVYSSASFYENGTDEFGLVVDIREVFGF